jgi:uncharacterized protein (DUF488 family)
MTEKIYTIGFTKTSAQNFFDRLRKVGAKRLIDVRLNNTSQLSGFAKADDLKYFLREILGIEYHHEKSLAPEPEDLSEYRKGRLPWADYASRYMALISRRKIETRIPKQFVEDACLLCSEATPHHCHRRLVCEYLNSQWGTVDAVHL